MNTSLTGSLVHKIFAQAQVGMVGVLHTFGDNLDFQKLEKVCPYTPQICRYNPPIPEILTYLMHYRFIQCIIPEILIYLQKLQKRYRVVTIRRQMLIHPQFSYTLIVLLLYQDTIPWPLFLLVQSFQKVQVLCIKTAVADWIRTWSLPHQRIQLVTADYYSP